MESLTAADDWLFDQEMDAPAKIFTDKLSALKKDFGKFFKRLNEKQQRPKVVADLLSHLNNSENFYGEFSFNLVYIELECFLEQNRTNKMIIKAGSVI